RVRDALLPDDAVTRRLLEQALAPEGVPRRSARRLESAVAITALALILGVTGAIVWQSRRRPSPAAPAPVSPYSLAVTGTGSIVVVEHPDGRRWIVGPPPERR